MDYRILKHEIAYQGFFRMDRYQLEHQLYAGGWGSPLTRELFERGHAAAVLPYDPELDAVVFLEQFRIGALQAPGGPWLMEIVAGIIEPGELPEEVIGRECKEEAGLELGEAEFICDFLVSPGGTSERIALYCGRVDAAEAGGVHGLVEEGEDIRVTRVAYAEACELLTTGRLNSASVIMAMQWLMMNRERIRAEWVGS
jgi:ADP-ribose pyrophosphatase